MTPTHALEARLAVGGFEPLLPAQRLVQLRLAGLDVIGFTERLDRGLDRICTRRSNGAAVEPLHHHAYPRRWHRPAPLRELP